MSNPETLGALKASGWESVSLRQELRRNAITKIQADEPLFPKVLGYESTVTPQLENALLAGHDIIFLGERGQAKTRMIRGLTGLLDEWVPIVAGSGCTGSSLVSSSSGVWYFSTAADRWSNSRRASRRIGGGTVVARSSSSFWRFLRSSTVRDSVNK